MRKLNTQLVRDLIEARGWSINELGRRAGLSGVGVLKVLRGENEPKLSTVIAIADALGFEDLDELLEPAEQEDDSAQLALAM